MGTSFSSFASFQPRPEDELPESLRSLSEFQSRLYRTAIAYAVEGYAVIPMKDKIPLVRWKRYQSTLPRAAEIMGWPWTNANGIALVIGESSSKDDRHLVVIDIEQRHRGEAERWLDVDLIGWRGGLVAESGSGGLHLYCIAQEPVKSGRFRWGDIKGQNSLVLLPPSKEKYRWISRSRPLEPDERSIPFISEAPSSGRYLEVPANASNGPATLLGQILSERISSDDVGPRILKFLGIDPRHWSSGSSFLCPLCDEENPSASLFRARNGQMVMRCWHAHSGDCPGDDYILLPSVYAAQKTKEFKRLEGGELAAWTLRLLHDAGLVSVKKSKLSLGPLSRAARILVNAISQVEEITHSLVGTRLPVPFTRAFAMVWCGLSEHRLKKAWREASDAQLVAASGRAGLITLWVVTVASQRAPTVSAYCPESSDHPPHNSLCSREQGNQTTDYAKGVAAGGKPASWREIL